MKNINFEQRLEPLTNLRLTLVVPFYNESQILNQFLDQLIPVKDSLNERVDCQVLFVDNGSSDESFQKIMSRKRELGSFHVLRLTRNFGYENALIAGLTHAEGDLFAICDSDGEDPVLLLNNFLDGIEEGFEIAIGIRRKRFESRGIQFFRFASYKVLSKLSDDPFRANAGNFSMFTDKVRQAILLENKSFPFLRSTFYRSGYACKEYPHNRNPRIGGRSKYRRLNLLRFAIAGFLTATTSPLRFVAYSASLLSFNLLLFSILTFFTSQNQSVTSMESILITLFLIHFLIFSGISSLYLARVYKEALNRPIFYVEWLKSFSSNESPDNGEVDRRGS